MPSRPPSVGALGMSFRTVLVENEEHSLARLERLLRPFERELHVVGRAADGPAAVELIGGLQPDLLFLDIDLPGCSGFEVLEQLDYQPAVIFVTAFNEHALKAFNTFAIDYLLKPVEDEALARALGKLRTLGFNHGQFARALEDLVEARGSRFLRRLSCRVGDRTVLLKIGEVLYFQADNKYTSVHVLHGDYLIDTPLVDLERKLDPREFVRIHRGTIVNAGWISEIRRNYDGRLHVVLRDGKDTELAASRTYADNLRNL